MIRIILLLTVLAQTVTAQDYVSDSAWTEDLRFLQRTVHADYPFLFKKTTAEEFDNLIEGQIATLGGIQPHERIVGLAEIISSFGYGHTHFRLTGEQVGFAGLPLRLYAFSDGIFVEGVHRDHARALGAKVVKIAGVDTEKVVEAVRAAVPVENEQFYRAYYLDYLTVPAILHAQRVTEYLRGELTLTLEKAGETFTMTIPAGTNHAIPYAYGFTDQQGDWLSVRDQSTTPNYLRELDKHYYFEYLPESKTAYVRYSQVEPDPSESIPDFYDRVFNFIEDNNVEKLVLDVRLNGGGNNFNNKHVVTSIIQAEEINRVGKLFVIIGRRTFSACQNLVNELDNYTNAIFVGEPTGENVNFYGDNRPVQLPNSQLTVHLSWAWWQDKPQWQNAEWTSPHLPVQISSEDYRENRDPVLERALTFDNDNFILDPMGHLTELFQNGKFREVEIEAKRMAADPNYAFFDLRGELTQANVMLRQNGREAEADALEGMIGRVFPE